MFSCILFHGDIVVASQVLKLKISEVALGSELLWPQAGSLASVSRSTTLGPVRLRAPLPRKRDPMLMMRHCQAMYTGDMPVPANSRPSLFGSD